MNSRNLEEHWGLHTASVDPKRGWWNQNDGRGSRRFTSSSPLFSQLPHGFWFCWLRSVSLGLEAPNGSLWYKSSVKCVRNGDLWIKEVSPHCSFFQVFHWMIFSFRLPIVSSIIFNEPPPSTRHCGSWVHRGRRFSRASSCRHPSTSN